MLLRAFAACLALLLSAAAARADENTVRACVQHLGDEAIGTVKNSALNTDQKRVSLETIIQQGADLDWMGKFVLGVQWRRATPAQQSRYLDLYKKLLLKNYTARFQEYTGSTFKINGVEASTRQGDWLVRTQIDRPSQQPVMVDYRAREEAGVPQGCKIFDLVVEGVSLIATQRSEYTSFTSQKGLDGLNAELERRLAGPADTSLGTGQGKKS